MSEELTNVYIDIVLGNLHKALHAQFSAEANYAVIVKDLDGKNKLIDEQFVELRRLEAIIEETKIDVGEKDTVYDALVAELVSAKKERDALKNKSSQVDQFARQINSLNVVIDDKDKVIVSLNETINELKKVNKKK